MTTRFGTVVVGVGDGFRSPALLPVAAAEAERRGARLTLAAVLRPDGDPDLSARGRAHEDEHRMRDAVHRLEAAADLLRTDHPRLEVTTAYLRQEQPAAMSTTLQEADLLVLGARSADGRTAFGLGSVSWSLITAVHCPLLVVPEDVEIAAAGGADGVDGAVVAGVGGVRDAVVARRAAEEAGPDERLEIVHAYHRWPDEAAATARTRAWEACAAVLVDAGTDRDVAVVIAPDEPATALLRSAARARLLVVGTRGPGALAGLAHDSVSRRLVQSSPCPVLVVPRERGTTSTIPADLRIGATS